MSSFFDDRNWAKVVFRNKLLTNVVVTVAMVFPFTIGLGYISIFFHPEPFGIPVLWFLVSVVAFLVICPIAIFYRSRTLPKSVTFVKNGLVVSYPFARSLDVPYEYVLGVTISPVTSHETLFSFETADGNTFRLYLENYEVDRMINLLNNNDLPRKTEPFVLRGKSPRDCYPIKYRYIFVHFILLVASIAVWIFIGENHRIARWTFMAASGILGFIWIAVLHGAKSVSFEESGTVMETRSLLPPRKIQRVLLRDTIYYAIEELNSGVPTTIRITTKNRIVTLFLGTLHRGNQLRDRLEDLFSELRIKKVSPTKNN